MNVQLKSVYAPYDKGDGTRYLAESLWPEGVETYDLHPFEWIHELAPSYELKEMAVWKEWTQDEYRAHYLLELQKPDRNPWFLMAVQAAENGCVTLLYNSRRTDSITSKDSTAFYLKEFMNEALAKNAGQRRQKTNGASASSSVNPIPESILRWSNEGGR